VFVSSLGYNLSSTIVLVVLNILVCACDVNIICINVPIVLIIIMLSNKRESKLKTKIWSQKWFKSHYIFPIHLYLYSFFYKADYFWVVHEDVSNDITDSKKVTRKIKKKKNDKTCPKRSVLRSKTCSECVFETLDK